MNVEYVPGKRTLKNFLAAALRPAGETLYIYGGGWNYEDTAGDQASVAIGLSESWQAFFWRQDENFSYLDYRTKDVNRYHALGLDCSGYIGWAVYNARNRESGGASCVVRAVGMARRYARDKGWGSFCGSAVGCSSFRPGDIFSMDGHVWLCVGACADGSLVILHATPSPSRSGRPGGGVQLGAIGRSPACRAYGLADAFMRAHCPEWSRRYRTALKDPEEYMQTEGEGGRFRWHADARGLEDPDGLARMEAGGVLAALERCCPPCGR